ncbi:MAG: radical SAM protein [Desulfobacterales bacterium]|nr:radical SAM protein [Desulfobacterales bacterium]MDD4073124.1 radical SAM protein [Desulfobacterales bacterium]MDD4391938.1 radical SAM protein [Desulfobacterales bacterium]
MNPSDYFKNRLIEANRQEYGQNYNGLKWLSVDEDRAAEERRSGILSDLRDRVKFGFKEAKLDCTRMSPGCEICGQGVWSCLFINGKCNCHCFYCPAEQNEIDVPTTNSVQFLTPSDYVDYIEKFQFKGVSISGGEPLLTFDRSLSYLAAVKKKFGGDIYTWLYTNGTLATPDMFLKLRDAGLDEIRFDIGAAHYSLEKAASAVGVIPHVTVEIPAVPEAFEQMKLKILEMKDAGINFLNLHQLRLTPHNFKQLARRGYTFLHGEKVTVLESELVALDMIRFAKDSGIDLPINYCSFVYQNRFQKAAMRKRSAQWTKKSHEDITENGYIRALCLTGNPDMLKTQAVRFQEGGFAKTLWSISTDKLYFSGHLWPWVNFDGLSLRVSYFEAKILPSMTYRNFFVAVPLNSEMKIVVEKMRVSRELELSREEQLAFERQIIRRQAQTDMDGVDSLRWPEVLGFEIIESGLQAYF